MLSSRLLEILRDWWRLAKPKPWLFPGDIPGRHITSNAVELACREAHRASRISKPITPHSMRHAFSVHLLERRTDVRTIQLLLGHRSLATTARYLRIATNKVCSTTCVPPKLGPVSENHLGPQSLPPFASEWNLFEEILIADRPKRAGASCLQDPNLPLGAGLRQRGTQLVKMFSLSRPPDVAMVETSHLPELNNLSHSWRLNGPRLRGVFAQR